MHFFAYLVAVLFTIRVGGISSKIPTAICFATIMRPVTVVKSELPDVTGVIWISDAGCWASHINNKFSISACLTAVVWIVKGIIL